MGSPLNHTQLKCDVNVFEATYMEPRNHRRFSWLVNKLLEKMLEEGETNFEKERNYWKKQKEYR